MQFALNMNKIEVIKLIGPNIIIRHRNLALSNDMSESAIFPVSVGDQPLPLQNKFRYISEKPSLIFSFSSYDGSWFPPQLYAIEMKPTKKKRWTN